MRITMDYEQARLLARACDYSFVQVNDAVGHKHSYLLTDLLRRRYGPHYLTNMGIMFPPLRFLGLIFIDAELVRDILGT